MRRNHISTDSKLQFHVAEWGERQQPTLLMLHGLASTSRMFDLAAPILAQYFHVVAFDQRGHGLSDKPDSDYTFETIASDALDMLHTLQLDSQKVSLAGHSWGAYTALYLGATHPLQFEKLVLIDGGIEPIGERYPMWTDAIKHMSPPDYTAVTLDEIHAIIRDRWLREYFRPELEPLALSVFDCRDPENVTAWLSRDHHLKIVRALWEFDPFSYFSKLAAPTLGVMAAAPGTNPDPERQHYAQKAAATSPYARFVWMKDTIHDIPWHRPDELASLMIDFLRH